MADTIDLRNEPASAPASEPVEQLPVGTIGWSGPLYIKYASPKSSLWMSILMFVLAAGVIALDYKHPGREIITALLFVIIGIIILVRRKREVPVVDFFVNNQEVIVGQIRYPTANIKSFWIQYEPEYAIQELSLHLKNWTSTYIKIPIGDVDPVQLRAILLESIPEEEHSETIFDILLRWIGL